MLHRRHELYPYRESPRRSRARTLAAGIAASVTLLAGALAAAPAANAVPASAPLATSGRMASFDAQMLSLINGARAGAGVPTVHWSSGLTSLSVWWSTKLADGATGYQLQHNPDAWSMLPSYGASNRTAWAENVAAFSATASASAVFDAYMNSPGHRANILSSKYHYVGVGTVSGSKGAYNTMEFTDKVDGAEAPPTTTAPSTKAAPTTSAPATSAPTRSAPATSAPSHAAPSSTAAPSKPAPTTAASQNEPASTVAHRDPVTRASASKPARQVMSQPASVAKAPTPEPEAGVLSTSFGALGLAGAHVAIREADCTTTVRNATTNALGRAPVTARPGTYCAVVTALPGDVRTPRHVTFTVREGHSFAVAWDHLEPAPAHWSARAAYLPCPV